MTSKTNEEVVDIIENYLRKQAKPDALYRVLANCMLDFFRMEKTMRNSCYIGTNECDKKEFIAFAKRVALNCQSLRDMMSGKTANEPLIPMHIQDYESNVKPDLHDK